MYQRTPEDKYFEAEELIGSTEKLSEFDMLILNSEHIELCLQD